MLSLIAHISVKHYLGTIFMCVVSWHHKWTSPKHCTLQDISNNNNDKYILINTIPSKDKYLSLFWYFQGHMAVLLKFQIALIKYHAKFVIALSKSGCLNVQPIIWLYCYQHLVHLHALYVYNTKLNVEYPLKHMTKLICRYNGRRMILAASY